VKRTSSITGGCSVWIYQVCSHRAHRNVTVTITRVGSEAAIGRPAFSAHVGQTVGRTDDGANVNVNAIETASVPSLRADKQLSHDAITVARIGKPID
jgi:hypothetical protein